MSVISLYKKKGETPLEALERLRTIQPQIGDSKLSYAGRLDPMAEGVMIVLVGEETKKKEEYIHLDKIYVAEILFGISTDTGDSLGKMQDLRIYEGSKGMEKDITDVVARYAGKISQKYPTFSSKVFAQAGSFEKARDTAPEEELFHDVEIYSVELVKVDRITPEEFLTRVTEEISLVHGDFRQQEILAEYTKRLKGKTGVFHVATVRLHVSSGFYVRQYAQDLGALFNFIVKGGLPAHALSITREQVGKWTVDSCVR